MNNNRVVLAFLGDQESLAQIRRLTASHEVIAVTLDLGGAVPLNQLRDHALAAGASRCHAFDVREEFAREALLPAVRAHTFADPAEAFTAMAADFIATKVAAVAAIENAVVIPNERTTVAPKDVSPVPVPPVRLQIAFEDGMPVAVNDVPMTLTELMESIETISGESALTVLQREYAPAAV